MPDLVEFGAAELKGRAVLLIVGLIALMLGWIAVSNQVGNMLAENTRPDNPNSSEISALSLSLAPRDPQARYLASVVSDDAQKAIENAEIAVKLAPNDLRWRVALGRAYEQRGQMAEAEGQLNTAVALAPSHAYPHWHLGNSYLRQGREDEAVQELKQATRDHFSFREQVFSLGWEYFNRDPAEMERIADENPETRAYLARFLANRGEGEQALRVWNGLGESEKQRYQSTARWTVQELFDKGQFLEAQQIARQLGDTRSEPEKITNPSFEDPLIEGQQSRFGWELSPSDSRVDFGLDTQFKHSGNRSVKITFRGLSRTDLTNLYQTVVVKPDTLYTLRFHVRSEGLRSIGRPLIQIVSSNANSQVLASTLMFEPDRSEWGLITLTFRTTVDTNAVSIRTVRKSCGDQCALSGSLWYDDFELLRGNQ